MSSHSPRLTLAVLLCLGAGITACGGDPGSLQQIDLDSSRYAVTVPAKGTASTLDVANWNLEWFGSTSNGPTNEALQLSNIRDVIAGTDFDVWGLEEVVSTTSFASLISQLPGYSGLLANDPSVVSGTSYYTSSEQKPALLYRTGLGTVVSARLICTANDFDFAGRPPLEVQLNVTLNGVTERRVFIVLHMKAFNDTASWQRRQNAANALKSYLDATYPTQKVFVVGDWNDDVDTSITAGEPTPFAQLLGDPARYTFETKALTDANIATTVSYTDTIDHQLDTNEQHADLVAGSVEAYRDLANIIPSYGTTTTDHYPVLSRYQFGAQVPAAITVTSPNGGETWSGGSTQAITWTSAGATTVSLEYTLDGASWTAIATGVPASAGSYSWTLPNAQTSSASVRVTDSSGSGVSDASDAPFTINPVRSLTVTAPNGGESWVIGTAHNITWTSAFVSAVKLEYSVDNGATWTLIASSAPASSGAYAWTVPAAATTTARVRATDALNGTPSDTSDAAFTIATSSTPAAVIINEILANEPGSNTAGEFVELVNVGGSAADLSGWTISDATSVRHTFAAGTSLAAGKAIVVFASASAIPAGLTNAVGASTGSLSLANAGDTVTLRNASATVADQLTYGSALAGTDGVSMNRNPDATSGAGFVLHTAISGLANSPGTRASGAAF